MVTDLSLDELKRWCKGLRFLELEGCYGILREVGEGDVVYYDDDSWVTEEETDEDDYDDLDEELWKNLFVYVNFEQKALFF